jgi:ABC-type transporter Mla subunit MlaD
MALVIVNNKKLKKLLKKQLESILMKIDELGTKIEELGSTLGDSNTQLTKALDEIKTELQKLGEVPQNIVDALDRATTAAATGKTVAQALDDLNPDPEARSRA